MRMSSRRDLEDLTRTAPLWRPVELCWTAYTLWLNSGANFAFETTLAGRTQAGWLKSLRESGYTVELMYFWLSSADLAVARVAERVRLGGHNVPEATIRHRYGRSLANFFRLYMSCVTRWQVFDTTQPEGPQPLARGGPRGAEQVFLETEWQQMQMKGLP